jgi:GNAT superfamily N-acetyltransferase
MPTITHSQRENLLISTDPALLDHDAIAEMLSRAYWAQDRPRSRLERALENSLVFGLYDGPRTVGVARVITDYSIFAYLCDVFIHEEYRGQGLGKWLVETILAHPDLINVRRWVLLTSDAHSLYTRYGFASLSEPEEWLQKFTPKFPENE